MVKVSCKITLEGDKECARDFIGAAQSQMRILENEMTFQELEQGVRRTQLNDRITVECTVNHQIKKIEIHCAVAEKEKEKEEEGEEFTYRFFAKVRRGGLYKEDGSIKSYEEIIDCEYYWLRFKRKNGQTQIQAVKVRSSDKNEHGISIPLTMWAFSNLPLHMTHAATKSFMLDSAASGDEPIYKRWVATQHALAIDITIVFYPLYFAFSGIDFIYPYPPVMGGDGLGGYTHPVPPNRFYCDTEKGLMAWYSVKTIPNPYFPDMPPLSYVFGLLLRIDKGLIVALKVFNCNSSELDLEGFEGLFFYKGTDTEPLPLYPEVPIYMMSDINSISNETLEVFVPWGNRPVKIIMDLTGPSYGVDESEHSYEAVNSCDHWYWTKDGFEQKLLGAFSQEDKSGMNEYDEITGSGSGSTCSGTTEDECCPGCGGINTGNVNNLLWKKTQEIVRHGLDKQSWIKVHVFDEVESMSSAQLEERYMAERRESTVHYCWFDAFYHNCVGPLEDSRVDTRTGKEAMRQKIVDSVDADWSNPNVAFVGSKINRIHAENEAYQRPGTSFTNWGKCGNPSCFELCHHTGPPFFDCGPEVCGGAECFYGYPFPNPEWADSPGSVVDHFQPTTDGYQWTRTQEVSEYSNPLILQYRIDGEGSFSSVDFNRTYYLDDRATNNSHGLLAAARGAQSVSERIAELEFIPEGDRTPAEQKELTDFKKLNLANWEGYPIFEVANWGIIYKTSDEEFTEITDELLKAIDCDKTELIELGLI